MSKKKKKRTFFSDPVQNVHIAASFFLEEILTPEKNPEGLFLLFHFQYKLYGCGSLLFLKLFLNI